MRNDEVIVNVYSFWFNREFAVSNTLNSLKDCRTDSMRFIFIDDCSTDGTYEKLFHGTRFLDNKVVCSNEKNIGFSNTLSKSISEWQEKYPSKYIAILGSGDKVLPGRFEKQLDYLEGNEDCSFVSCKYCVESEHGQVFQMSNFYGDIAQSVLHKGPKWTHGSVMYRSSAFFDSGGYNVFFKYCQDWDLYARLLRNGKGYVINEMLYIKKAFQNGASYNPEKRFEQLKYSYIIIKSLQEEKKIDFDCSILNDHLFLRRLRITLIKLFIGRQFHLLSRWRIVIKKNYSFSVLMDMKVLICFVRLFLFFYSKLKI